MKDYFVYILQCADGSYYVGFTTDLKSRSKKHKAGYGSTHSKEHAAEEMVYSERFENKYYAPKRESQLKHWSRAKKEALIRGDSDKLRELSKRRK